MRTIKRLLNRLLGRREFFQMRVTYALHEFDFDLQQEMDPETFEITRNIILHGTVTDCPQPNDTRVTLLFPPTRIP